MDRDAVWALFEKTGNIGAYMLYQTIGPESTATAREADTHADENRRADYPGPQRG